MALKTWLESAVDCLRLPSASKSSPESDLLRASAPIVSSADWWLFLVALDRKKLFCAYCFWKAGISSQFALWSL
jgi:hypothetical protein